eukprot:337975-Hanusia_phi.AAC.1
MRRLARETRRSRRRGREEDGERSRRRGSEEDRERRRTGRGAEGAGWGGGQGEEQKEQGGE